MSEQLAYTSGNSHAVAIYGMMLLAFFALCYPLSLALRWLETAFGAPE